MTGPATGPPLVRYVNEGFALRPIALPCGMSLARSKRAPSGWMQLRLLGAEHWNYDLMNRASCGDWRAYLKANVAGVRLFLSLSESGHLSPRTRVSL
jgi:hypothetical protein